jgi:hypothetical protein
LRENGESCRSSTSRPGIELAWSSNIWPRQSGYTADA